MMMVISSDNSITLYNFFQQLSLILHNFITAPTALNHCIPLTLLVG